MNAALPIDRIAAEAEAAGAAPHLREMPCNHTIRCPSIGDATCSARDKRS
jgi:hypothetical protein